MRLAKTVDNQKKKIVSELEKVFRQNMIKFKIN